METLSIFILDILRGALEGPRWIRWPVTAVLLAVVLGMIALAIWAMMK